MKPGILLGLGFAAIATLYSATFTLSEAEQALIIQFGNVKGEPQTRPGIHWKLPFVQEVRYFDKRILTWDGDEEQIPTSDKKYIWVDTTARWRISDPKMFAQTVHNEVGARDKLDGVLDGITRDTISNHRLVEAVRNTNDIIERLKKAERDLKAESAAREKREAADEASSEEDSAGSQIIAKPNKILEDEEIITGEVEPISVGREQLSRIIIGRAREELKAFGIELIDVQLRRIAYEKSVEQKVYDRMVSERKRIAQKIRSIGKGEVAKIQGTLNRDLKEIESVAYRKSQEIKGEAEAEAIAVYANSLRQGPDYYNFVRTLEAYKKSLPNKGHYILSTDSEFLKVLGKKP